MKRSTLVLLAAGLGCCWTLVAMHGELRGAPGDARQEIVAFNEKFQDAHLQMDTPGIIALWAETGVSLLPETAPIVGKAAIGKFVTDAVAGLTGYKMLKVEMDFHDLQVSGEWASEWAIERQLIQPPDGKPVIDHYGKFLLVLHKQADGSWKVQQEMWNSTPKPAKQSER